MSAGAVEQLMRADHPNQPRADARRNLSRIVEAARTAIAEEGLGVTAHEIAHRAGVGVGTFYRRVGSRETLLEAVSREVLAEIVATADRALDDSDPWRGFATFAERFVHLRAESCGLHEALGGAESLHLDAELTQIRERIHRLVARAQDAGALRRDVEWSDVPFLLAGVITVPRSVGLAAEECQWRTNLRVLLDGLQCSS